MEWAATVALWTLVLLSGRTFLSITSRLALRREKRLALQLARLLKEKCQHLENLSQLQKQHEAFETALKEARLEEEAREGQRREVTDKKLSRDRPKVLGLIPFLLKQLKDEQAEHLQRQPLKMADISNRIRTLAEESTSLTSEIAEMKVALSNTRKKRLQRPMAEALTENAQQQESHSQLSQEAQRWKQRVGELTSQKRALQDSQARAQQLLQKKGKQVKALTEQLLSITTGWPSGRPEDTTQTGNSQREVKSQLEKGPGLGHQPNVPLEKGICGARVNASFKTMEEQRNQLGPQLSEAEKNRKELAESLQHLQTQQASLRSAYTQLRGEHWKLEQKLAVREEFHHQTVQSCYLQLRQHAKARAEQQRKMFTLEEVGRSAAELETYRKTAQGMQEEWEKTIRFHQRQGTSMQREARKNWHAAAMAQRHLHELRQEKARTRNILCAMELKAPLLGQDPATVSTMKSASGREHSPRAPAPRARRGPARSAPRLPTLWEEPLGSSASSPAGPESPA